MIFSFPSVVLISINNLPMLAEKKLKIMIKKPLGLQSYEELWLVWKKFMLESLISSGKHTHDIFWSSTFTDLSFESSIPNLCNMVVGKARMYSCLQWFFVTLENENFNLGTDHFGEGLPLLKF